MGIDPSIWKGKRVLVTGHNGFKGSWLVMFLKNLGVNVIGLSLPPESSKSLFLDAKIGSLLSAEYFQDIRDDSGVQKVIQESKPDYVFHLAAQALVRRSISNPRESISTNVTGTVNVLLSSFASNSVLGVTIVTTDKVYQNIGDRAPFKETDRLGSNDPYSASKAAAELIVASLVSSSNPRNIPVTTVRAGNVIGGGDWGEERLVPDVVQAIINNSTLVIRNPSSTRPWQHVLDCLFGYLLTAQAHLKMKTNMPQSINFGPKESLSVIELVKMFELAFKKQLKYEISKSTINSPP